jgi:hypothetical protein
VLEAVILSEEYYRSREMKMAKTQTGEIPTKAGGTETAAITNLGPALDRLEPILDAGNKFLENWMAVGTEFLEFSRTRLSRSLEASKAIARASSLDEAIELQAEFTRSILSDFLSEASKLADLGTQALLESMRTLQPAASEATERRNAA